MYSKCGALTKQHNVTGAWSTAKYLKKMFEHKTTVGD